ncbi:MAG: aldo/keto reductase [Oscillospiraceae bacterium]|nr:aldo/keto reductase [Oscillospiraceae bacterium]
MELMNEKKLGFGCMRLPVLEEGNQTSFDYEKMEKLFDTFIEQGFTYFDTAYTYHGYEAEKAVKKALVDRHPREAFQLATKMPLRDFKDSDDLEKIFNEQLANCGVEYFDYYLLHNMGYNVYDKCVKYDAFNFVKQKKADGKIKVVGMSFHDMPELLDKILSEYGDCFDFVQLQINYIDMDQANVRGRECLEVARKYGKPVTVMEPCKGGTLVNLPEEAEKLMKDYAPDSSAASWAMRFAASQQGVFRVLSGMNSMEQVLDNCKTFVDFKPLNDEEMEIIRKAVDIINSKTAVPCTACEYCTHGCPKNIAIPQYFAVYNSIMRTTGSFSSQQVYYNNIAMNGHGKASECIKCGKCEQACPQHLPIRSHLEEVAGKFEGNNFFPTRQAKD